MKKKRILSGLILFMLLMTFPFSGPPGIAAPAAAETFSLPAFKAPSAPQEPMTADIPCNWELTVKDSQEYLYTENGETLKKIVTVDITATKQGGTDYYGDYIGEGTVSVFHAVSPGDDAYPVTFGGQKGISRHYYMDFEYIQFTLEEFQSDGRTEGYTFAPPRLYDGYAAIAYEPSLDEIQGIFHDILELDGLMGRLGEEFSMRQVYADRETAVLYADGGYVRLAFENDWQLPETFIGSIVGIPGPGPKPAPKPKTTPKGKPKPGPTPAPSKRTATTPVPTVTPAPVKPNPITLVTPVPLATFTPKPTIQFLPVQTLRPIIVTTAPPQVIK